MPKTHKRAPYLEIAITLAALGFLGLVILGGFDQRGNNGGVVTMRPD
jgi:multisubunit Na+/H+ antiporter MnhF subunit